MRRDIYQIITAKITDLLKQGVVPWHKPWKGRQEHPRNLVSGREYRGINAFILTTPVYDSPYWLTFKQAKERDGNVKKGEKGFPCIYWNWIEKDNPETGEKDKIPFMKYYTVFNVEQCEQVAYPQPEARHNLSPIEACEKVVAGMPNRPAIRHGGDRAFYHTIEDFVQLPTMDRFKSPESYYSTLFHELTHSTGHESRLSRHGVVKPGVFGSHPYSREELVAEMGAAFLGGYTGIENRTIDNSTSYIGAWLDKLNNDNRLVVTAGAQAQNAADYILGERYEGVT